ncbi:MAG: hypothetical protein JW871_08025 [Endomicrobiales bacterium]|nr:hypothetical protein [Endomicrobiales bacterium]
MLAVIFGLMFIVLGLWGVVVWWPDFLNVIKGLIPFMFVCGGFIAMIAGITSIADSLESKETGEQKEDDNPGS